MTTWVVHVKFLAQWLENLNSPQMLVIVLVNYYHSKFV